MDNQFLVRALAAHAALDGDATTADPAAFLKRANDAFCLIEGYADGTLGIREDIHGNTRFSRKTVEPNTDPKTAKEQPIKVADNDEAVTRVRHMLATHGNSAIALSTLIHSGVVTPNEARVAAGLPPLAA